METGLISVDRWTEKSQIYFLSHLHATEGLYPNWSKGPIFCSDITAKLFPFKVEDFNLSLIRTLSVGIWHSIPVISPSTRSKTAVEVMAIDAHHCPGRALVDGAVMFLFRGEFGILLYTGDFRWEATSERANIGRTMLLNALKGEEVDILYLDNTYCNPTFNFPSREFAAQQAVDIITSHPEHDVIIGVDSLGKEDLLLFIARTLNIKIWVWPERLRTMHLLGFLDIFTTNTTLTRVRAVPRYSFSIDTLEGLNSRIPTIGIMPSGHPWLDTPRKGDETLSGSLQMSCHNKNKFSTSEGNVKSVEKLHEYIYSVPYSDHSCFPELHEFIKLVKPTRLKSIAYSSACYVDPIYYFGHLCGNGNGNANESERKGSKTPKFNILGANARRFKKPRLARRRHGPAKIVDTDSPDD